MKKPEHLQDCAYINRPWPRCPACAYEEGWKAGVDAVVESGALDLCSTRLEGIAREAMAKVDAVRERVK